MKKAIILSIVSMLIFTGCGSEIKVEENQVEDERFIISDGYKDNTGYDINCTIITDTKTNVQYIIYDGYYSGGICPLYNENGEISIKGE